FVLGVDLSHALVQVELAKRITGAEAHRLGRVALAPQRLLADDDPGGPVRVEPVDAVDAGRADRLALRFDHPPDIVLRFADLLQELLLLLERDRHASRQEPRDLHVGEPAHEVLRIVLTSGAKGDLVASEQRPEHRSGQNTRAWSFPFWGARRPSPARSTSSTRATLAS